MKGEINEESVLVTGCLVLAAQVSAQELVGKTFWCRKPDPTYYIKCGPDGKVTLGSYGEMWKGGGFVSAKHIEKSIKDGLLVSYDPVAKAKEAVAKGAKDMETRLRATGWPMDIQQSILERKVMRGMTAEQARLAWGKPSNINSNVGSWGTHEQWVYDGGNYLYFENGKLTSWQTSNKP
jgi:hypothetical protein